MNTTVHALDLNTSHPHYQEMPAQQAIPLSLDDSAMLRAADTVGACDVDESRIVVHANSHGMAADRFRLLRFRLRPFWESGKLKTLIVTSALPREGKTTMALNLATSLSEHGNYSVALVEADFRHPSLADRLGLTPAPGLVKSLESGTDPFSAIRRVNPFGFYVLPAGESSAHPITLLSSRQFSETIARLRACVDWVIIDSPPVSPIPDLLAIKSSADGCLWVVRAGATPREIVDETIQQFGRELVIGIVLNGADVGKSYYPPYYQPDTSKPDRF
ncbi:MAG: CpsD/CapB family tyrosine-protein kinase [Terracidiphilus sp.]